MKVRIDESEIERQLWYKSLLRETKKDRRMKGRDKTGMRGIIYVFFRHGLTAEEAMEAVEEASRGGTANALTTFEALVKIGKKPAEAMKMAFEIDEIIRKSVEEEREGRNGR